MMVKMWDEGGAEGKWMDGWRQGWGERWERIYRMGMGAGGKIGEGEIEA